MEYHTILNDALISRLVEICFCKYAESPQWSIPSSTLLVDSKWDAHTSRVGAVGE